MQIREVEVEYSRTVSDGNYGSERYGMVLSALVNGHEDAEAVARELYGRARALAVAGLAGSDSPVVRRAVTPVTERERRHDAYQTDRDAWERDAQRYVSKPDVDEEDDPERPF
jgi:hypothetical protein